MRAAPDVASITVASGPYAEATASRAPSGDHEIAPAPGTNRLSRTTSPVDTSDTRTSPPSTSGQAAANNIPSELNAGAQTADPGAPVSRLRAHPYDLCAELVAREAGVIVTDDRGEPLRAPLDLHANIAWIGYANAAIQAQLEPTLMALLEEMRTNTKTQRTQRMHKGPLVREGCPAARSQPFLLIAL